MRGVGVVLGGDVVTIIVGPSSLDSLKPSTSIVAGVL